MTTKKVKKDIVKVAAVEDTRSFGWCSGAEGCDHERPLTDEGTLTLHYAFAGTNRFICGGSGHLPGEAPEPDATAEIAVLA